MKEKYTIGLDFGTLSGRAVLVSAEDGHELASSVCEYAHGVISETLPQSGEKLPASWALEDPRDYAEVLKTVIPDVIKTAGIDRRDIIAIGVDFTCSTFFPIDASGTPLCFGQEFSAEKHAWCKLWKHHGAQRYADRINALYRELGEDWMDANLGGKISAESFLPKVWETLEEAPRVYRAADSFTEACDWINFLLTGKITRGYIMASYKECYRREDGYIPKAFLKRLNPELENLFEEKYRGPVVMPGQAAGYVTEEAAAIYGLPEGIPVAASMPDAYVGCYSVGNTDEGHVFGILGTSNCYFLSGRGFSPVPGICGCVKDGILPDSWMYESGLSCFGDHFAWVAEKICPAEYAEEAEKLGISKLQLLIRKASALRPGESGLLALDWWNGNRSILNNGDLSGVLLGMTLQTKAEDILRALIEATAFGTRMILDNFREHGVEIKRFTAAGGVPRKDAFTMQLFADILELPIDISSSRQAAALGAAVHAAATAGKARGGYDSVAEAISAMKSPVCGRYEPDPEAGKVYNRLYAEYRRLHDYFGRGENTVMNTLRELHG